MNRKKRRRLDNAVHRRYPPIAGGPGRPPWMRWRAFVMLLAAMALVIGLAAVKAPA